MSTPFYDLASLVVVPSGYKASKVYAQKPLTTDGQLTFSRASTATRVNSAGLIETVSSNVPRLDYLGSTCPKLLLEPQRTNLATYSENWELNSAGYSGGAFSSNQTNAPDGYQSADKYTVNTANSTHGGYFAATAAAATAYSVSAFIKAGTGRYFLFRAMTNSFSTRFGVTIDLLNGTILSSNTQGTPTGTSSKIENYGNGWYRVTLTMNSIDTQMAGVWGTSNTANPTLAGDLDYAYTGNGTDSYFMWGMQIEAGAYATSYIPTTSAAVTRLADACSKTGISSLIGQTEGVLYIECNIKAVSELSRLLFVSDGTLNNFINIYIDSDNKIYATTRLSASTVSLFASSTLTAGTYKIAYAYKANDFILYINGTAVSGSSSANIPATSRLEIGSRLTSSSYFNSFVNQALLFKSRLTNAQLAELTAL